MWACWVLGEVNVEFAGTWACLCGVGRVAQKEDEGVVGEDDGHVVADEPSQVLIYTMDSNTAPAGSSQARWV